MQPQLEFWCMKGSTAPVSVVLPVGGGSVALVRLVPHAYCYGGSTTPIRVVAYSGGRLCGPHACYM